MANNRRKVPARDRILEAALRLFSSKGYLGATTREIANEAGVAEVTLFRHFASKEILLEEVFKRRTFLPTLMDLIPELLDLPYEEGLTIIANSLLDTLIEIKDWIRVMHGEIQREPEKLLKIYHSFLDSLFGAYAAYFKEMRKKGELRDFDPELAARAFHNIFFCYFNIEEVLLRKKYKPTDRKKTVAEFVRIFARGTMAGKF